MSCLSTAATWKRDNIAHDPPRGLTPTPTLTLTLTLTLMIRLEDGEEVTCNQFETRTREGGKRRPWKNAIKLEADGRSLGTYLKAQP